MHFFRALWISILYLTILICFLPFVTAQNLTELNVSVTNSTNPVSSGIKAVVGGGNESYPYSDPSLIGTKNPTSDLVFSESGSEDTRSLNETEESQTDLQKTPSYDSIGDIIAAKDWKALSEYTCKMKTENPGSFTEGATADESREKFRRFLSPDPPAPVSSCCG